MSILRPYQQDALAAMRQARLAAPEETRIAIEMATGLGKTVTFAQAIVDYLNSFDGAGNRVLVLVHTDELVRQAVATIAAVNQGRFTIGVVKANENEIHADIIVASVQTLASHARRRQIRDVGFIVVDECHHATAPTYRAILEHFNALPGLRNLFPYVAGFGTPVLGVTATLARSDGSALGQVWQNLVFSRGMMWAIRKGWLVDIVPWTIKVPDIDALASDARLDAMLATGIAPEKVVEAWLDKAAGLSTVLFAPAVASAQRFADAFNEVGVKAEIVHGGMSDAERDAVLARLANGTTMVVANCMVLTEGWDCPRVKCVIVARPTKSVPLFIQMVGRGLRPWLDNEAPSREDQTCIVLSLADTTTSLVTVSDLSDKPLDVQDGKPLTQMEDEFDLGRDIEPDEIQEYRGAIRVEQWDPMVQASSKAWKRTRHGVPFLPYAKRGQGYVFIVDNRVFVYGRRDDGKTGAWRVATAPDISLAMAMAEDEVQDRGGDIGALLADKSRPWRKGVPSLDMLTLASNIGVTVGQVDRIMSSKQSGKAGKLSDLIDTVMASKVIDPIVTKIQKKEAGK